MTWWFCFVSAISRLYLLCLPPHSTDTTFTLHFSFDGVGDKHDYPQHLQIRLAHLSPAPQTQHLLFRFLLPSDSAVREIQIPGEKKEGIITSRRRSGGGGSSV